MLLDKKHKPYRRFSDLHELTEEEADFAKRRFSPNTFIIFLTVVLALLMMVAAGLNADKLGTETLIAFIVSIFLVLGAFLYIYTLRIQSSVLSNEFSNALFAGAAGTGAEFCIIIRRNRKIVYFNPSFHKYFSINPDIEHPDMQDVFKPYGFNDDMMNNFIQSLEEKKSFVVPFEYRDVDGNTMPLMLEVEPILRPKGYFVIRAIGQSEYHSSTDQKIASIPVSRTYIERMLNEMPIGAFIADMSGTILYSNTTLSEHLSYKHGDLVRNQTNIKDLVFGNEDIRIEFRERWVGDVILKTARNRPYPVQMKLVPIATSEETQAYAYGFVQDKEKFTTQTTSSAESESAQKVYKVVGPGSDGEFASSMVGAVIEQFIELSPVPAAEITPECSIIYGNQAFNNLVGEEGKAAGYKVTELIAESQRSYFEELLADAQKVGAHGQAGDFKLQDYDEDVTVSIYINPISLPEGDKNVIRFILYAIDNSEQKSLEQKFAQSQKMQAVGQLAGGIAHDFNNLLTAMIGFCDLLLTRHPPGDQSFADIMQVKQNANRAANLVRQLLAFSRRQTLQPVVMDITDTIAELSNLVRRLIGENIELNVKYQRDLWLTRVDHGQLEQVIINLAVNARDAMPKGGELEISTKNINTKDTDDLQLDFAAPVQDDEVADGEYVAIDISDTGEGIPQDIMQQIFEPFFTTKEVGAGTGLGLATVHGIVKQTGGYILVKSKPGEGTTFRLLFKRHIPDEKAETAPVAAEAPKETQPKDLTGTETILLVEDEDAVRKFSATALGNKGYKVLEADCGEAGLERMQQHGEDIDIIITDVVMPGITGPSMVEEIIKQFPDVKVIFISGYGEDAFVRAYGAEREFNFLPKPYSLEQLVTKVKDILGS